MTAAVRTVAAGAVSVLAILAGTIAPAGATNPPPGGSGAVHPSTGFPPVPTPFTVRVSVQGGPKCLDRSPDASLHLRSCEPGSVSQRWVQKTLDGEGFGLVYDIAGDCIIDDHGRAVTEPARECDAAAASGSDSWKQLPDGTVAAAEPQPGRYLSDYWKVDTGRSGGATFSIGAGPHQAGAFAVVPSPATPSASPTPTATPTGAP
jgi:hypothetical protein